RLALRGPGGLRADLDALLGDPGRSAPLRENLARELAVDVTELAVEIKDDGSRRMTAEQATQQRMSQWMARDPRLKEAVEELDLTLKE
ncbi:MAG: hypothetical protein OEU54_15705, partial [Gemmatimonadota bacterium]|nr:hypothetical protein [Gemmatimonadota bacterium]